MGLLDDLKHKAGELGDKAKEGLDAAKDKAGDLIGDAGEALGDAKGKAGDLVDDVKDRFGQHDETSPLSESSDIAPDAGAGDVVSPETADLDPVDIDAAEALDDEEDGAATGAVEPSAEDSVDLADDAADDTADEAGVEPALKSDIDPFDAPLSETIGDEIAANAVDADAVSDAVGTPAPDSGSQG